MTKQELIAALHGILDAHRGYGSRHEESVACDHVCATILEDGIKALVQRAESESPTALDALVGAAGRIGQQIDDLIGPNREIWLRLYPVDHVFMVTTDGHVDGKLDIQSARSLDEVEDAVAAVQRAGRRKAVKRKKTV